ncbi:hypothetical protein MNB_SUP05-SYMBIONT-4-381 [hydrothermal vent metagenome]|uniref:PIN domain-containing protein n=1 Tax=hydrothermal vent metagenome TaxID=652676 RepID=A0A1W1DZQ1_9ZZZZ
MNILIDTHIFLWATSLDPRLKQKHIDLLKSGEHNFYMSAVSVAEIMIKINIGKFAFDRDIEAVIKQMRVKILELEMTDVLALQTMRRHHNDPFDRMLISQSINREFPILTYDKKFPVYDCKLI